MQDQCAGSGSQEIRSIVNTNKHKHTTSHRLSHGCKAVIQDTTIAFSIPLVHKTRTQIHAQWYVTQTASFTHACLQSSGGQIQLVPFSLFSDLPLGLHKQSADCRRHL